MTRKDYKLIADVLAMEPGSQDIRLGGSTLAHRDLVERFVTVLERENPAFRPNLFRNAAGAPGTPRNLSQ